MGKLWLCIGKIVRNSGIGVRRRVWGDRHLEYGRWTYGTCRKGQPFFLPYGKALQLHRWGYLALFL